MRCRPNKGDYERGNTKATKINVAPFCQERLVFSTMPLTWIGQKFIPIENEMTTETIYGVSWNIYRL